MLDLPGVVVAELVGELDLRQRVLNQPVLAAGEPGPGQLVLCRRSELHALPPGRHFHRERAAACTEAKNAAARPVPEPPGPQLRGQAPGPWRRSHSRVASSLPMSQTLTNLHQYQRIRPALPGEPDVCGSARAQGLPVTDNVANCVAEGDCQRVGLRVRGHQRPGLESLVPGGLLHAARVHAGERQNPTAATGAPLLCQIDAAHWEASVMDEEALGHEARRRQRRQHRQLSHVQERRRRHHPGLRRAAAADQRRQEDGRVQERHVQTLGGDYSANPCSSARS